MISGQAAAGETASRRGRLGGWWPVAAVVAVSVLVALGGEEARAALRYERAALEAGEVWRLLTAHVAHLGWPHVAMNMAAVVLIRLIAGDSLDARDWLGVTVAAALAIDLGLYLFSPHVYWYVGYSGVSHGLLAAAAVALWPGHRRLAAVIAAVLAAKLLWEQFSGAVPGSASTAGGDVIVDAHLYGACSGIAWGVGRRISRRLVASL